ncbi:hypothetical protein Tco_1112732 [Tanacetum coccineum]|uniref:Retrovirus-related Pol polyprotein from transposon TNT 1-94-like beta-barrel domain-containing protein n=1 Tax=Tanacetum coccineum TaxID=301880 RepID=A0ABQ5IQD4_9ASTR
MFQANHEDAYAQLDEGPMRSRFLPTCHPLVQPTIQSMRYTPMFNQIFDNVDYQLSQEMHQEEHLDSDAETEIDDNTIPYHQYLLDTEAQNVPTEVSADTSNKKPKKETNDLHKDILGTRNPGLGYMAKRAQPVLYDADTLLHPNHHPVSIWDSDDVLVHQVVSMKKMNEKPGHVRPKNGFYEKLNALIRPPSQVLASLRNVNAVFPQFEGIIKERTTQRPDYVSEWCFDYAKQFVEQQLANTPQVTAYTEKLSAFTAENTKLKAQVTGVKPTSGASKTVPKRAPQNHSSLPAKNANARRFLSTMTNVVEHTKRFKRQPRKEWKPIKRVWKQISKPVANSKPQWKPTGRHFSLFEKHPLTRIMESTDQPIELPPSATSSPKEHGPDLDLLIINLVIVRQVVQIVLWYLDSGCSRHMTGDRARLINFVEKFIGTVRFGNDEYAAIVGYGDYKLGDTIISRVYYVEGLKHNLFSVGQFCDGGLEVAFRQHSCHIRNYDMMDLLKGSRTTNLYSIH